MPKQNPEKVTRNRTTEKIDLLKKSVEKMQARGKTCFLQHRKNTTHLKSGKGSPNETLKTLARSQNANLHHAMMILV